MIFERRPRVVIHALHADMTDPGNILHVNVTNT